MIDQTKIQTAFTELVGFKEEQEITLSSSLQTSNSGLYVNDLSGIDLQSINQSQWIKTDLTHQTVTEYLEAIYEDVVLNTVNNFINKLQTSFINRDLKKDSYLVKRPAESLGTQSERFVGYVLRLKDSFSLRMLLKKIAIQANKAQTIRIFLYEMSKQAPLSTFDYVVSTDKERDYQDLTDWVLTFATETNSGNTYLLGYYESISDNVQTWMLDSDSECYYTEICVGDLDFKYLTWCPITIDKEYFVWTGTTYNLPDVFLDDIVNSSFDYFPGLMFKYAIDCDYTHMITENVDLFAEALQYEFALRIISDALSSKTFNQLTESNQTKWNSLKLGIESKLNGYSFTKGKETGYSEGLYDTLLANFEDIDCDCFRSKIRNFM